MTYWLGIDLGTTYTAAALCRPVMGELETQVVRLGSRSPAMPSVLFLAGDGSLAVGEAAERYALTDPDRVVREFKRRIGDEIPLLVGGIIPDQDIEGLKKAGVAAIFQPGTAMDDIVKFIRTHVKVPGVATA